MTDTHEFAAAMCIIMHEYAGSDMTAIVEANTERGKDSACASHDFFYAYDCLAPAWELAFPGVAPWMPDGQASDATLDLIKAGWTAAKCANYTLDDLAAEVELK